MGFRTCPKSNIINDWEVKLHMSKKHPKEWLAIEDQRKEKERQEDRIFQRTLYEAVGGKKDVPIETRDTTEPTGTSDEVPLYVSDKPPKARRKKRKNK